MIFILPEDILKSQHSCFLSSLEKFQVLSLCIPFVPKFQHSLFLEVLLDICLSVLLSTKVHVVKVTVFPVVMYGLESWTIKKAEC